MKLIYEIQFDLQLSKLINEELYIFILYMCVCNLPEN